MSQSYLVDLSIVIPLFNEDESIEELVQWILGVKGIVHLKKEIILVDDGSNDLSWEVITQIAQKEPCVKGVRMNRNYGKSAALQTGFNLCQGEIVITMDADLQDSPDEIPEFVRKIREEGWDLISGWKKKRHDPIGKTLPSKFFNYITRKVSGIQLHDFNCGLKAYKGEVVKNISVDGEMHRYIPLIAKWNGYSKISEQVVQHYARKYGVTKFGMKRFITGFLDLISVSFTTRFRKNPMHLFGTLGTLSFFGGFAISAWIIAEKLYKQHHQLTIRDVVNQPLFFLALVAIIIGVQLFLTGFLADLMVSSTTHKEEYHIKDKINCT